VLDSAFWGLIQGLTEFLPISSSGHLVIIPALLGRPGPDLATSAVLHVGTLGAVLAYFWRDLLEVVRRTPHGKRLLMFLIIGTVPAGVAGLAFRDVFEQLNEDPRLVAIALIGTGIMLLATRFITLGKRTEDSVDTQSAVVMGLGQAIALIPGVSRSGTTITAGLLEGFEPRQAARLAFLLGIPAIAGAGLLNFVDLADEPSGLAPGLFVGVLVAAGVGYAAIAFLLRLIERFGLVPYGWYCVGLGTVSLFVV